MPRIPHHDTMKPRFGVGTASTTWAGSQWRAFSVRNSAP